MQMKRNIKYRMKNGSQSRFRGPIAFKVTKKKKKEKSRTIQPDWEINLSIRERSLHSQRPNEIPCQDFYLFNCRQPLKGIFDRWKRLTDLFLATYEIIDPTVTVHPRKINFLAAPVFACA